MKKIFLTLFFYQIIPLISFAEELEKNIERESLLALYQTPEKTSEYGTYLLNGLGQSFHYAYVSSNQRFNSGTQYFFQPSKTTGPIAQTLRALAAFDVYFSNYLSDKTYHIDEDNQNGDGFYFSFFPHSLQAKDTEEFEKQFTENNPRTDKVNSIVQWLFQQTKLDMSLKLMPLKSDSMTFDSSEQSYQASKEFLIAKNDLIEQEIEKRWELFQSTDNLVHYQGVSRLFSPLWVDGQLHFNSDKNEAVLEINLTLPAFSLLDPKNATNDLSKTRFEFIPLDIPLPKKIESDYVIFEKLHYQGFTHNSHSLIKVKLKKIFSYPNNLEEKSRYTMDIDLGEDLAQSFSLVGYPMLKSVRDALGFRARLKEYIKTKTNSMIAGMEMRLHFNKIRLSLSRDITSDEFQIDPTFVSTVDIADSLVSYELSIKNPSVSQRLMIFPVGFGCETLEENSEQTTLCRKIFDDSSCIKDYFDKILDVEADKQIENNLIEFDENSSKLFFDIIEKLYHFKDQYLRNS